LQELDSGSIQSQFRAYSRSKLANVLIAKQLHRTEARNGITTYVAHPGKEGNDVKENVRTSVV